MRKPRLPQPGLSRPFLAPNRSLSLSLKFSNRRKATQKSTRNKGTTRAERREGVRGEGGFFRGRRHRHHHGADRKNVQRLPPVASLVRFLSTQEMNAPGRERGQYRDENLTFSRILFVRWWDTLTLSNPLLAVSNRIRYEIEVPFTAYRTTNSVQICEPLLPSPPHSGHLSHWRGKGLCGLVDSSINGNLKSVYNMR